jgi:hypothetical protein
VNIQATGSNNPAAPLNQEAAQTRRAYVSQKMRRGLSSRSFFSDFFDSKMTEISLSDFSQHFFVSRIERPKQGRGFERRQL